MGISKVSAKGSLGVASGGNSDIFHSGGAGYIESAAVVSGSDDAIESGYDACLVWNDGSSMSDVVSAIKRLLQLIETRGVGF